MYKIILGELLHLANSQFKTRSFYALKDIILREHGNHIGWDTQHIEKPCYFCERGWSSFEMNVLGERKTMKTKCQRCDGNGVYEQFWTLLMVYRLGSREFHLPMNRYYTLEKFQEACQNIASENRFVHFEGYIVHEAPPINLGYEAGAWLILLFDRKSLKDYGFGKFRIYKPAVTPMLLINNFLYVLGVFKMNVRVWLYNIRSRFCRHEFTHTAFSDPMFDACQKCGAERWEIDEPRTFEIPF